MATVLLPWNLASYAPLGGFSPLLKDWLEIQAHVDLVRPKAPHELDEGARAEQAAMSDLAMLARLPANVEFHHTAPLTTGERPFVLHCETVAGLFAPYLDGGRKLAAALKALKTLLASPQCLAVYAHLASTREELAAVFGAGVAAKVRRLPIRLPARPAPERPQAAAPTLLFVGPDGADAERLVAAGLLLALKILEIGRRATRETRLIVAAPGARAALDGGLKALRSAKARQLIARTLDAVVWVDQGLTEASRDRLFQTADFCLAPGLEPRTGLLAQALRHGCIPIALSAPGVTDFLKPGRTGLVAAILDDGVLARHALGFVQPDAAAFLARQPDLLEALDHALRPWTPLFAGAAARETFRAALVQAVESQFMQDGQFHELDDLLRVAGAQGPPTGDLHGWTVDVRPEDYAPRRDTRLVDLAGVTVDRVGRGFAARSDGQAPQWFASADAAVLEAISRGPEPFNVDILPRLSTAESVRTEELWDLTLFAPGILPLTPPDAPFVPVRARVVARNMAPHGEAGGFTLAAKVGERLGPAVSARMARWTTETVLEVPAATPGEPVQLAIAPDRPGLLQLLGVTALGPDGEEFPADYRELPGVGHRSVRLIPADAPLGHVVFGPYLPLERGAYLIQWRAFAMEDGPDDEVLLTLEILLDEAVAQWRDVTRHELKGAVEENIQVAGEGAELQFRLSHWGRATIGLQMARVFKMLSA